MAVMRDTVVDSAVGMAVAASRMVVAVSAVMVVAEVTAAADACGKRADPFRNWEGSDA
jgi:hypothetical protein